MARQAEIIRLARTAALVVGLNILMPLFAYAESIPLKLDGGTYVVPVLINSKITLDFTLDSGAAEVTIPADVFGTLRRTETISKADLLEPGEYVLADGSPRHQLRFRIKTLKVGDLELRNVVASVSPMQGSLLLGQSFLSRIRTWAVDNQRHVLVINEGTASTPMSEPNTRETSEKAKSVEEDATTISSARKAANMRCASKFPPGAANFQCNTSLGDCVRAYEGHGHSSGDVSTLLACLDQVGR